jgi:predicted phage tail protein
MLSKPTDIVSAGWSDIGPHEATLSWVIDYTPINSVEIKLFNDAGEEIRVIDIRPDPGQEELLTQSAVIDELEHNTHYHATIDACNHVFCSEVFETEVLLTHGIPDAPTGVTVDESSTADHLHLTWTAPYNGGFEITQYNVEVSDGDHLHTAQSTGTSVAVDVHPNTQYTIYVEAVNEFGVSIQDVD